MNMDDVRQIHSGSCIVSFPFHAGGNPKDRCWMVETNGEVDYGSKKYCINSALSSGYTVVVVRWHRDGSVSVVEKICQTKRAMDGAV